MEHKRIRILIREEIAKFLDKSIMDEMAYPTSFNFNELKNIKSFSGKVKYVQYHLGKKIGKGSSRAVFRVDDEKVLKVALNKRGLIQNESEAQPFKQNYGITAKVFDADPDDIWVEMELAKKVNPRRFEELAGVSIKDLQHYLSYRNWLNDPKERAKYSMNIDPDLKATMDENEFVSDLTNLIADYAYPMPGDFGRISTYGEVTREGEPTLVLVDFGLSSDASSLY